MFNVTVQNGPDTTDPAAIDWASRQSRAVFPFDLDENGHPINPIEPYLPAGRGGLWHWGEAVTADAIVFATVAGARYLLMIERGDGHGWALPGGGLDEGETPSHAVVRELAEETGLFLDEDDFDLMPGRYVPDPRAGRAAWMVTVPSVAVLRPRSFPIVAGHDDARNAAWLPAASFEALSFGVADLGSRVFPAHVELLREALA